MAFRRITRWYGNLFNERVRRRLRSARHAGLSHNTLLFEFVGRKTGKSYSIPVNYRRLADGKLVIGTEASWWRNLEGGADVGLVVAGESLRGRAAPIASGAGRREQAGRLLAGFTWPVFSKSLVLIEIEISN